MAEVSTVDDERAGRRLARIEELLDGLESAAGLPGTDLATEAVGLVVELYGDGLGRIARRLSASYPELLAELAQDELIAHLLLLHGLHPVAVEERVKAALEEVRPYLESHGGGVELLDVSDSTVRLRLRGSCSGCPSSAITLKLAVEDAIRKHAPEVEGVEAEADAGQDAAGLLQIGVSDALRPAPADGSGTWTVAGGLPQLNGGGKVLQSVAGDQLLFVRLGEDVYAYRPRCAACGASLEPATLDGGELVCADCQIRYDVRRAGRCVQAPETHLEPVPLLVGGDGLVRVALGAAAA